MPQLAEKAAAYTRTGILKRFLDTLSESLPSRVDTAYAENRLGLKGGDVRAFLQSVRVLGLIDPYGHLTDRAKRTRSLTQRPAAIREGLAEAYPDLIAHWNSRGGMSREELEGEFKVHYGLSASSAGPAAKLFIDLMRDYGRILPSQQRAQAAAELPTELAAPPMPEFPAAPAGAGVLPQSAAPPPEPVRPAAPAPAAVIGADVRLAALEAIKASLRIDINAEWDEERIQLVFDRMERLMGRILNQP